MFNKDSFNSILAIIFLSSTAVSDAHTQNALFLLETASFLYESFRPRSVYLLAIPRHYFLIQYLMLNCCFSHLYPLDGIRQWWNLVLFLIIKVSTAALQIQMMQIQTHVYFQNNILPFSIKFGQPKKD